ncbi:MAG: LuxR C-terminal-related transcriptional regulator, partial [Chloroflexota bacterium]
VLMMFSIFRGGFDVEAAQEVTGATLPLLAGLADKSLIRVSSKGRYDLHELLRQFAMDKLSEAGLAAATADHHLGYFMMLGEQAEAHDYGHEQTTWYDRLEADLDNIRAALAWSEQTLQVEPGLRLASALVWFWENRAHGWEGHDWLVRLLALDRGVPLSIRAKALNRAGDMGDAFRDRRSRAFLNEALALARSLNDEWNIAWALANLGRVGFVEKSIDSVPLFDEWNVAWAVAHLGHVGWVGKSIDSASLFDKSLAVFRKLGDPLGISHLLRRRAWNAIGLGDYAYAQLLLEEALVRGREVGAKNAIAWSLHVYGLLLLGRDQDTEQAAAQFLESLALFRELEDLISAAQTLNALGVIEYRRGNAVRSAMRYVEALFLLRENGIDDRHGAGCLLMGLGHLAVMRRNPERAARLLAAAEPYWEGTVTFEVFDSDVQNLRAQLGEAAFAAAWAEGKAMTREQAVAYALQHETPPEKTPQSALNNTNQPLSEPLSARELEVLHLIAEGLSNAEIAQKLFISIATIKVHAGNIYGKLGVNNRTQAVALAQKLNLL